MHITKKIKRQKKCRAHDSNKKQKNDTGVGKTDSEDKK